MVIVAIIVFLAIAYGIKNVSHDMGRGWGEGLFATLILTIITGIGVMLAIASIWLFFSIFIALLPVLIPGAIIWCLVRLCADPKPKAYRP